MARPGEGAPRVLDLQEPFSKPMRGEFGNSSQFSPQKTSRHSSGGGGGATAAGGSSGTGGGGSGFIAGRRSRSASPSTQQEKHPSHHERAQKKVKVFSLYLSCHKLRPLSRSHRKVPHGQGACPIPATEGGEGAAEVTREDH